MSVSVEQATVRRPRTMVEIQPRMAKAGLTDRENPGAVAVGQVLQRALSLLGWTVERCAQECGRDRAAVSRWIAGTERTQLDTLWAVEELRQPLAQAFGEFSGCDVSVVIQIRRQA